MTRLNSKPETFREKIIDRLFDMAKIANLTPDEYRTYQNSEDMGYSYQNTIDYAREEGVKIGEMRGREIGRAEGINESRIETARNMKANGISAELIAKCTGLALEDVLALQS